ncbi:MAG: type IX secretion system sortase PorU [Taibaiella sp.]|nr:type IX secretion system sortase PorU [Taibaiella sp.]
MKRIISVLILLLSIVSCQIALAQPESISVTNSDIYGGYFIRKIWLENYAVPKVSVSDISYIASVVPAGAALSTPDKTEVLIGMERKHPFAVIRIPAYSQDAAGKPQQISAFNLTVTEEASTGKNLYAAKTTADVTTSALAEGTWYKIGITRTGFHKIDAAFITSMGLDPGTINPAHIRVFGNGGRMLPEANSKPRATDLRENAIMVYDGGDNKFNTGDYAIFYGMGPTGWDADTANKRFTHQKNIYSDTAYYFITFNKGAGLRISERSAAPGGNVTVADFNYYDAHDIDLVSPAGIGKNWYGEDFNPLASNLSQSFNFDIGAAVSNVHCKTSVAVSGDMGNTFNVSLNGALLGTIGFPGATNENTPMLISSSEWTTATNSASVSVNLNFLPSTQSSLGYLNYIELNARRPLVISGDQLSFRDLQSIGAGNVANYQVQGANSSTIIWDVTDPQVPVLLNGALGGSTYSFSCEAQTLHEFAAMNSLNLYQPIFKGNVLNQNLHGLAQVDNIIISNSRFLTQANELADYHRAHDNMRVVVATPEQVYNEFSSGAQDISAIRDFARMFYKRAGTDSTQMPHYLTFLGGASYDYKDRLPNNSNFVPVFESAESSYNLASFSTDDFYGFLDDNEDIENNSMLNALDLGVGRIPARTIEDAVASVNKIKAYKSPATLGPWRLASTIVADNNDGAGNHMQDGEDMATHITATTHNLYNHSKIYLDAIPSISTPAGHRSPNANASISDRIFKGTMFINYSGHGNTQVWTDERILTQDDFNKWKNINMLPFMVTATCDYGQFDHPQYVSAAEKLVLNNGGGVISILTTTAPVYASYNNPLNALFLKTQFTQKADGKWHSFGDASRIGKNATYLTSINPSELANYRKFALLGDPALTPNFPEHFVHVDSVIDVATSTSADTIKALGAYRISGAVRDNSGNTLTGFNGILSVSFYDKPRTVATITQVNKTFLLQDNLVYKGKVSVTNGRYSYTFIAPKDINYFYGVSKISNYAHNGITDAAGVDTNLKVGGYSDNPVTSDVPPIVKPYINDSLFYNGGITGSNTSLFVSLFSETGINVSGNKLGHDLTAVLDDNIEQPYILNDYYETAPNTYQRGFVTFPINGLANGKHTIKIKAWDVNNNSGEGSVDFVVLDGKVMGIENLMNYPNPFSGETHFVFEHNHPEEELDVQIYIYTSTGALAKNIDRKFTPTGSRSHDITWDGTDNHGVRLPSGMYVYRMMITTDKGYKSTAYQKLVIVR